MYGLSPTVSWSNSNKVGDVGIDYGIEADLRPTKDITSLTKSIWGKLSSSVGAWGVSATAESQDYTQADVEIGVDNSNEGLKLSLVGTCGSGRVNVKTIKGGKTIEADGATISINPRFDVQSKEATVATSYEKGGTGIKVEASKDTQTISLSRQLDEENRIEPTINSAGDISLEWEHRVNDCTVTTTFKPEESISVVWEEKGWKTNISMDLEEADVTNLKVSMKKDLTF